jgi:hypothetical protein
MGKDTHALSDPAQRTALQVLAANNVDTAIQRDKSVTPTPVISRAILVYNRGRKQLGADLAQPRSLRALERSRLDAALVGAAPYQDTGGEC